MGNPDLRENSKQRWIAHSNGASKEEIKLGGRIFVKTFEEWIKTGGCGLSQWAAFFVSQTLCEPESRWRKRPLEEIMAASEPAEREIRRFARENNIALERHNEKEK